MRWIAMLVAAGIPCLMMAAEPADFAESVPPSPDEVSLSKMTLEQCVSLALGNHPRLSEYDARVTEAEGTAVQAGLYPNPRIDSGNPQTIGGGRTGIYTIGVTQEVIRGGKLKLQRAAATEAASQARWDAVRRKFEVLTTVRQEFFSTLAAQRRVFLLQELLKLAKSSERTSMNLLKAEQVSETDVLLLRVERRKAETALQSAEIALVGQRRQLAASIGVREESLMEVEGNLKSSVTEFDDEEVLTQVLTTNPLVQSAAIDINRTIFLLRRAEVEPVPNLIVQGGTQYQESNATWQGLAGLYIYVPIWDKNTGNIIAAQASVRKSIANRQAVQQELTKDLAEAITRFRVAERAVKNYEEGILPDAMRTLELVQKAYERGQFEILRLLQTQRTVFEVNIDYVAALENRLNSAADIAGLLQLDEFP